MTGQRRGLALQPLRRFAFDSLYDCSTRGIVRPEFMDELIATYVESRASYYRAMDRVLMMIEHWFEQHRPVA